MNCIVGYERNGIVTIGCDSLGVAGLSATNRKDTKVFKNGDFIFGCTSSFRMIQILQYCFKPPKHEDRRNVSDHAFLCTEFVDGLVKIMQDKGYARKNHEEVSDGTFLLGYNGKLYRICSDFRVAQSTGAYDACGCGSGIALGAMYAIPDTVQITPTERLTIALQATSNHSAGVLAPFKFVSNSEC